MAEPSATDDGGTAREGIHGGPGTAGLRMNIPGNFHYIADLITRRGTLIPEDMKDDEFACGADTSELFNDNLEAFQRSKFLINRDNRDSMRMAA
jgi:hypothetical protein